MMHGHDPAWDMKQHDAKQGLYEPLLSAIWGLDNSTDHFQIVVSLDLWNLLLQSCCSLKHKQSRLPRLHT